jgi:hypothetical protein
MRHGQHSFISRGIRTIQSSGSDIEVVRTWKDSMAIQWGAEGKGSQCGGGARAMMEND